MQEAREARGSLQRIGRAQTVSSPGHILHATRPVPQWAAVEVPRGRFEIYSWWSRTCEVVGYRSFVHNVSNGTRASNGEAKRISSLMHVLDSLKLFAGVGGLAEGRFLELDLLVYDKIPTGIEIARVTLTCSGNISI